MDCWYFIQLYTQSLRFDYQSLGFWRVDMIICLSLGLPQPRFMNFQLMNFRSFYMRTNLGFLTRKSSRQFSKILQKKLCQKLTLSHKSMMLKKVLREYILCFLMKVYKSGQTEVKACLTASLLSCWFLSRQQKKQLTHSGLSESFCEKSYLQMRGSWYLLKVMLFLRTWYIISMTEFMWFQTSIYYDLPFEQQRLKNNWMYFLRVYCLEGSCYSAQGAFVRKQTSRLQKSTWLDQEQYGIIFSRYSFRRYSCSFSEKYSKYLTSSLLNLISSLSSVSSDLTNLARVSRKQVLRCTTIQGEMSLLLFSKSRLKNSPLATLFLSKMTWNLFMLLVMNSTSQRVDTPCFEQYLMVLRTRGMWKSMLCQSMCLRIRYFCSSSANFLPAGQVQICLMMNSSQQLWVASMLAARACRERSIIFCEKQSSKRQTEITAFAIFDLMETGRDLSQSLELMSCSKWVYSSWLRMSRCTAWVVRTPV